MASTVDPDQMLHFVASALGLHNLLRPVCPIFRVITVLFFCLFFLLKNNTPEYIKVSKAFSEFYAKFTSLPQ